MEQKQIFKKMIEIGQTTFNNTYDSLVLLQDQFEKVGQNAMSQSSWLSEDGKTAIKNWVETYKTGRNNLKKFVDTSNEKVTDFFSDYVEKLSMGLIW